MNLSRAEIALLNLVADDWTALDVAPLERQAEAMEWRSLSAFAGGLVRSDPLHGNAPPGMIGGAVLRAQAAES